MYEVTDGKKGSKKSTVPTGASGDQDINEMLGQSPETAFLTQKPKPTPSPTPTPK